MKTKIDAFIIGAHKCATTSLFSLLKQHPCIHTHEANQLDEFLNFQDYGDRYRELLKTSYADSTSNSKLNLARDMTIYCNEQYIQRLYTLAPRSKLVLMVRDPVKRAISSYHYGKNNMFTNDIKSLDNIIEDWHIGATIRKLPINNHIESGMYYQHVKKLNRVFPKSQLLILKLEDLAQNPQQVASTIYEFLGLDMVQIHAEKKNIISTNRSNYFHRLIRDGDSIFKFIARGILPKSQRTKLFHYLISLNRKKIATPDVSESTIKNLQAIYAEDLENLKREYGIAYV